MKIAIIGAGLAGCNLYEKLIKKGFNVKIFEKSRGTGGRLSSKYIGDKFVDHGTPYIKTDDKSFYNFLETKVDIGVLKKIDGTFYPTKGINKLCSSLIDKKDLITNTRIVKAKKEENKWKLFDENEKIYEDFDFLILTIPATQIIENSFDLNKNDLEQLEQILYEAMATLICFKDNSKKIDLSNIKDDKFFFKVIDNSFKYEYKEFQSFVFHINKSFVEKNILLSKIEFFSLVHKNIKEKFDIDLKENFEVIEHLWKFAFSKNFIEKDFILNVEKSYGICGDYFNKTNLEATYSSSNKLFEKLITLE